MFEHKSMGFMSIIFSSLLFTHIHVCTHTYMYHTHTNTHTMHTHITIQAGHMLWLCADCFCFLVFFIAPAVLHCFRCIHIHLLSFCTL